MIFILVGGLVFQCQSALASDAETERFARETTAVIEGCHLGGSSTRFQGERFDSTSKWTLTGWTGGCQDGRRDGRGIYSERWEDTDHRLDMDGDSSNYRVADWDVTFVSGKMVGLRCLVRNENGGASPVAKLDPMCHLLGQDALGWYRKEPDGRWRWHTLHGGPVKPAAYLPSGTLEQESDRMVASARTGAPVARPRLPVVVPDFGDIIKGGLLTLAPTEKRPNLRNKRVAVVLSANTATELERFARMRQEMIEATAKLPKKFAQDRQHFIDTSDPKRILAAAISGLRTGAGTVVPADDLSVLVNHQADYVLLFDWRFEGDFSLTEKEYEALPRCAEAFGDSCHLFFRNHYTGWLINDQFEAVRIHENYLKGEQWYGSGEYGEPYGKLMWYLGRYHFDPQFNAGYGTVWEEVRSWITGRRGNICPIGEDCI